MERAGALSPAELRQLGDALRLAGAEKIQRYTVDGDSPVPAPAG